MDETHREFFEDLARELEGWVQSAADAATNPSSDLKWAGDFEWAFRSLQEVLTTPQLRTAFRAVLFKALSGLSHSVLVVLDGGTQLADEFTITLTTSEGETLGPGLHELFYEHLYKTGRLPYQRENHEEG